MKLIIGCLLFCCTLNANANANASTNATDTMTMTVNKSLAQFRVRLPANPTTGYQWAVKQYDKTLLSLTDSTYMAPKTQLIGAGGEMVFTFVRKPNKAYPQKTLIVFKYARSWESTGASLKRVVVYFDSKLENNNQQVNVSPK